MSTTSGIYLIVCLINNKLYVGSAIDTLDRWRLHKLELNRNNHHNRHLQAAWNLYGEINFKFCVIEFIVSNLETREQYWIDRLNSADHSIGYNICKAGRNRSGVKASEETRQRLSLAHIGNKHSAETRTKMGLSKIGNQFNTGRKQSAEEIAKRVAANTGKKRSDEVKLQFRNLAKWPCADGRKCKCAACVEKKNDLKRKWRAGKKELDTKSSLLV